MAKYYYAARPVRWKSLKTWDMTKDEPGEWQAKARALQVRRWRALKHASKNIPTAEIRL
jgi:hypothetical protein